jgi:selenide,water dikinase
LLSLFFQDDQSQEEHSHFMHMSIPRIGIGMDSSITPLRHGGLSLVQTTDFFYPLVEDPYMQGDLLNFCFLNRGRFM